MMVILRFIIRLTLVMALLLAWVSASADVPSDWHEPEFPFRVKAAWESSAGASALLRLPSEAEIDTAVRVRDGDGRPIAARMVSSTAADCWVWMAIPNRRRDSGWLWVYYGAPNDAAPAEALTSVRDAEPWRVDVFHVSGVGIPDRWERMLFMRRQAGNVRERIFSESLGILRRQQVGENRALLDAQTFLHVTEAGRYRFGLRCRNAAFILLDDDLVCQWPGEGLSDDWVTGDAIALQPGVYRLNVLNSYARTDSHPLRVGWMRVQDDSEPATATEPEPIPGANRLAATELVPIRTEARDRKLHAGFRFVQRPAYRVHGAAPTFVPVAFEQATANWRETELTYTWSFGDGTVAEGPSVVHTYTNTGPVTVQLRVNDALGNEASIERDLNIIPNRLHESRLAAGITRVPAALFGDDRINPQLDINGGFQERSLDIEWRILNRDLSLQVASTNVTPHAEMTVSIPLASELQADSVKTISWRMSHAGALLMTETVSFPKPPFVAAPARIDAHRMLTADGDRIVWVTDRRPRWRTRVPAVAANDATREASARWITDIPAVFPSHPDFIVQPSRDWTSAPEVAGPMVKFLDVIDAVAEKPYRLMLGLGHRDYIKGVDADVFERQIAALTDWALAQEDVELFWSTPAPLTANPETIRPFAVAVRRVADVRGVPVLDLYSYFMGAPDQGAAWIKPAPLLGLSPAGAETVWRLAIETMNR